MTERRRLRSPLPSPEPKKVFLMCDDDHPDYFVGRFERSDDQLIPEMRKLNVGEVYQSSLNPAKHFIREA